MPVLVCSTPMPVGARCVARLVVASQQRRLGRGVGPRLEGASARLVFALGARLGVIGDLRFRRVSEVSRRRQPVDGLRLPLLERSEGVDEGLGRALGEVAGFSNFEAAAEYVVN